MKIQQIRSACMKITYGGKRILIDPWLGEKGTCPPVPNTANPDKWNPLVDLPLPLSEIIDVDAVIVTHLHFDHFDETAEKALPKTMPLFAQNDKEAAKLRQDGFVTVTALRESGVSFEGITMTKTGGEHGQGEEVAAIYKSVNSEAEVCGVVLGHPSEKTVYIAGDTVWCPAVADALTRHRPDIILLNAGDAQLAGGHSIIMGKNDVRAVCEAAPDAVIVATHMEAVNHATLSRAELRRFADENGFGARVLIPADGETLRF